MNAGPSPQEKVASWRKEQQHWPWVGDWPQIKNVTIQSEQKGRLQSKKPLYPTSYYPEKPVPVECWGCTIESDYRYMPICTALTGFKRTSPIWQNFRRPDGILELRPPTGFTLETQTQDAEETVTNSLLPNIDDEPIEDDDWVCEVIENFSEMPLVYNNPKLSNNILLDTGGYGHLGGVKLKLMMGEDNLDRIREINAWTKAHIKKLNLKELNSEDYSKLFKTRHYDQFGHLEDGSSDIHLSQILLDPPKNKKQWLELKKVQSALGKLMYEKWVAGKNPYEHAPNSPYGLHQDLFLHCRNQIRKETGLSYRAVSTALNRMLRKKVKQNETINKAFLYDPDESALNLGNVWNRTNQWQMKLDDITEAREKYGPDWLKHYAFAWSVLGFDEGYCVEVGWPHWGRYVKEFGLM